MRFNIVDMTKNRSNPIRLTTFSEDNSLKKRREKHGKRVTNQFPVRVLIDSNRRREDQAFLKKKYSSLASAIVNV